MSLSFSARDLITQLVREDGSIRGKIASLVDAMWLHRTGSPDKAIPGSVVKELLQDGLIGVSASSLPDCEEVYRSSAAGKIVAGTKAVADQERSARRF